MSTRHKGEPLCPKRDATGIMMCTATIKCSLLALAALTVLLHSHSAWGAPVKKCCLSAPITKGLRNSFIRIRNKYEDLRKQDQPWRNCSSEHLKQPRAKLIVLTGWGKLEALEMKVDLAVTTLQNHSMKLLPEDTKRVLQFLMPFQETLRACIQNKPLDHKEAGFLQQFKEEFQKFNTSNAESPRCLELAVGMNIHRLLDEDIKQVEHHTFHHHGCHHRHHRASDSSHRATQAPPGRAAHQLDSTD